MWENYNYLQFCLRRPSGGACGELLASLEKGGAEHSSVAPVTEISKHDSDVQNSSQDLAIQMVGFF
jgi:hypothetical protein